MHEFEAFEAKKFVSRLLGKADWNGFLERVQVSSVFRIIRASHAVATSGHFDTSSNCDLSIAITLNLVPC